MANPAPSLKALAESKTAGINKATSFRVNPNLIHFEEWFNLRLEGEELDAHIERLFLAMKAGAFIPPVDVSIVEGKIIARDGHCRTRAARRLLEEMPEYTLECRQLRGNESDAVLHMLGTGGGSKPLSPLEQGKGFLRLINMGLKSSEIAAKLGVSRATIDNGLVLAESPVDVQQMIAKGEVSATTARAAVKQGSKGVAALKDAVEKSRSAPVKKKVTAKKLKGTDAEKPKKVEVDPVYSNLINITFDRAQIEAVGKFLRDDCDPTDDVLQGVAATIERAFA